MALLYTVSQGGKCVQEGKNALGGSSVLMDVALDDVGEMEMVSGVRGLSPSCFCNSSVSIRGSSTR